MEQLFDSKLIVFAVIVAFGISITVRLIGDYLNKRK